MLKWRIASAQDTVPFCYGAPRSIWITTKKPWATVSALGDRDTTCAIVGGIVACYPAPGHPT
jgi:hypothetical protein